MHQAEAKEGARFCANSVLLASAGLEKIDNKAQTTRLLF
jgi:hypothetical protein